LVADARSRTDLGTSEKRRLDRGQNGVMVPAGLLKQLDELAAKLSITPLAAR